MNRRRLTGELDNDYAAKAFCIDRIKKIERGEIPYPACVDIAVGISGSGKSYLKTTEMKNRDLISPDNVRKDLHGNDANQGDPGFIIQLCTEKLKEALRNPDKKSKVYYDATNVVPDLRSKITTLCHDYGALVFLHVFDVSIETAKANNRKRSRNVPESVIEKQASKFELPLPEEAHHIFYYF